MTHAEPSSLSEYRALYTTGGEATDTTRLFHVSIYPPDIQGAPQLLLMDQAPQLHTEIWRVNADGTMDTVYRPRSDLTWYEGALLTADDFVLSWQMAKNPDYGVAEPRPTIVMAEAVAFDRYALGRSCFCFATSTASRRTSTRSRVRRQGPDGQHNLESRAMDRGELRPRR